MKQQEVFKKIGVIIKELNDQYEFLQSIEGPLNELELELFIANSNFLTDHAVILSKLNSQNKPVQKPVEKENIPEKKPAEQPKAAAPEKFFEPLVQPVAPLKERREETKAAPIEIPFNKQDDPVPQIDLGAGRGDDTYSFIREVEPETIRHELILDEAETWDDDDVEDATVEEIEIPPLPEKPVFIAKEEEVKPVAEVKPIAETKPAAEIKSVAETKPVAEIKPEKPVKEDTKESVPTINERISTQISEKSRAVEHHQQSIIDLKTAITLNDKLLYIKDLFNGYNLAYSEAIDILNRFSSFNEAETFLKKNYVAKNNWDDKPLTTEKFYALLKRRYE